MFDDPQAFDCIVDYSSWSLFNHVSQLLSYFGQELLTKINRMRTLSHSEINKKKKKKVLWILKQWQCLLPYLNNMVNNFNGLKLKALF